MRLNCSQVIENFKKEYCQNENILIPHSTTLLCCDNIIHLDKNILFKMCLTTEKEIAIVVGERAFNLIRLTFSPLIFSMSFIDLLSLRNLLRTCKEKQRKSKLSNMYFCQDWVYFLIKYNIFLCSVSQKILYLLFLFGFIIFD